MEIKGHVFGAGKPVICVPVVERTAADIQKAISDMTAQGAAMIEWRMDWYEDVEKEAAVQKVLEEIKPCLSKTIFLCTFRSRAQGGEREISKNGYLTLIRNVAESGVADLVDLEFFEIQNPGDAIHTIQKAGAKVVCSNHNFKLTPSAEVMQEQFMQMHKTGGDFIKLAVMPSEKRDVLRLMEAVLLTKERYPDSHPIAISMGEAGMVTRLLGGWFGSEVTFASFGKASAPGQADSQKVAAALNGIEECMR